MKKTYLIGRLIGEGSYSTAALLIEIEILKSEIDIFGESYNFKGNIFKEDDNASLLSFKTIYKKMIPFKIKNIIKRISEKSDYMNKTDFINYVDKIDENPGARRDELKIRKPIKKDLELIGDDIYLYPEELLSDYVFEFDDSYYKNKKIAESVLVHKFYTLCHYTIPYAYQIDYSFKPLTSYENLINDAFIVYNPEATNIKKYYLTDKSIIKLQIERIYCFGITNNISTKLKINNLFLEPTISDLEKIGKLSDNNRLLIKTFKLYFNIEANNNPLPFISLKSCLYNKSDFQLLGGDSFVTDDRYFVINKENLEQLPKKFIRDTILIQNLTTGKIDILKHYLEENKK